MSELVQTRISKLLDLIDQEKVILATGELVKRAKELKEIVRKQSELKKMLRRAELHVINSAKRKEAKIEEIKASGEIETPKLE